VSNWTIATNKLESLAMPLVDRLLNDAQSDVLEQLRHAKHQLNAMTTKTLQVRWLEAHAWLNDAAAASIPLLQAHEHCHLLCA